MKHVNICPGKGNDECEQYSAPRVTIAMPIPMKMTMKIKIKKDNDKDKDKKG